MANSKNCECVSVTELKSNLRMYLRKLEQGHAFRITDRGTPIAKFEPLPLFTDKGTSKLLVNRGLIPPVSRLPRDFFDEHKLKNRLK